MDTVAILNALRNERDRLTTAIAALEGTGIKRSRQGAGRNGRRRNGRRGRKLSEATKKRIGRMIKKRWKERKSASKE